MARVERGDASRQETFRWGLHARWEQLYDAIRDNQLLTFAGSMSFGVVFSTIPLCLFVLAVLGFLRLQEVWARDLSPEVRAGVSPSAYRVIDEAVRHVLGSGQLAWLTVGGVLTLGLASGAMRATMDALDSIYCARRRRPLVEKVRRSLWLAAVVSLLFVLAAAIVRIGPVLIDQRGQGPVVAVVSFVVRWGVGAALLEAAAFLIVRYGPSTPQPVGWVSFGSGLAVGGWVLMSIGFGLYITYVASYGSLYGSLASVIVLFSYDYLSCVVFLLGVQVDALVRGEARGDPTGQQARDSD